MNILCLDAEFTDNEEILELSIFNDREQEIYHSYFKPQTAESWNVEIHHITPEMVVNEPSFEDKRAEIQKLLDDADFITGFAVKNDLKVLTREGVKGLNKKNTIDVQDMYWYQRGRKEGMSPYSLPSLVACAEALGLDYNEEVAHAADADTEATVRCFNILIDEFMTQNQIAEKENVIEAFLKEIAGAHDEYDASMANGFIRLIKTPSGYKFKFSRFEEEEKEGKVLEVAVKDRFKAEYDMRKLYKKKELPGKFGTYKLTEKNIEDIKSYENEYNKEESAYFKKIVRNLSKLSL